jgi:hypothetical protein
MTKRLVSVLALALVLGAALVVSASPALAHGGKRGIVGKSPLVQAAATYIGVTPAELRTARQSGQSLAQLATAKGKTVQGLTDALVAAGTARIDKAKAAGKITAAQATTLTAGLPARVTALINATGHACPNAGTKASRSGPAAFGFRRR